MSIHHKNKNTKKGIEGRVQSYNRKWLRHYINGLFLSEPIVVGETLTFLSLHSIFLYSLQILWHGRWCITIPYAMPFLHVSILWSTLVSSHLIHYILERHGFHRFIIYLLTFSKLRPCGELNWWYLCFWSL